MTCIDLTSKTSKNYELRLKTFKTTQTYESDQIIMNCIDLTSKRSKMLSYVAKHSKQRKTTKVIKIQWLASIWRQNKQKLWVTSQNIQNYANLRKWSNYNELHRFDVKTIYNALWVTSQNIQNYAKLRKSSNYNQLHRFDVNTIYND